MRRSISHCITKCSWHIMKEKIRIGYIGLGRRGYAINRDCLAQMKDVEFVMLFDQVPEPMERAAKLLEENGKSHPIFTTDYKTILAAPTIDAYDTVTRMSIASLSEMSIQKGGAP